MNLVPTLLPRAGKTGGPIPSILLIVGVLMLASCASLSRIGKEPVPRLVGVAYMNLETDETLIFNGHAMFHAASTMKTPVMFQLFRMRDEDSLDLDAPILVKNEFKSIVDGSIFSLPIHSEKDEILYPVIDRMVPLRVLIDKMITHSSNLATNILVQTAKPEDISQTLNELGASGVLVLRGVEDLKAYELGMNNMTSAYGMMKVMEAVYRSELVSDSSRAEMIEILKRQHYNSMIPAGLPDDVVVAHKTGSITRIAHDAAIVYPPDAPPYILVILTSGWDNHDEALSAGARLATQVHRLHLGEIGIEDIPIPKIMGLDGK